MQILGLFDAAVNVDADDIGVCVQIITPRARGKEKSELLKLAPQQARVMAAALEAAALESIAREEVDLDIEETKEPRE